MNGSISYFEMKKLAKSDQGNKLKEKIWKKAFGGVYDSNKDKNSIKIYSYMIPMMLINFFSNFKH